MRSDVSLRKIARKISDDGLAASMIAGAEFLGRKYVFTPFFRRLIASGHISVVEATDHVDQVHFLDENAPTPKENGDAPYVTGIGDAYVLSTTGMGLDHRGNIVGETVSAPDSRDHKTAVVLGRQAFLDGTKLPYEVVRRRMNALETRATQIGAVCPLIPRYRNYFHWTIECLPRVRAVREYERRTGEDVTFLVPEDLPGWIAESLELVGCQITEIQPANSNLYRSSNLVAMSFPRPSPRDCQWIRKRVLENELKTVDIETGHNVYISRENARERRVLNEDVVSEILSEYGFRSYRLEELSVAEQAGLFNDADLVVGAHGAGLSNIVYSENTSVLELFGSKVKPNYANLSDTLGLTYDSLVCESPGVDLVVDEEEITDTIEKLTSQTTETEL